MRLKWVLVGTGASPVGRLFRAIGGQEPHGLAPYARVELGMLDGFDATADLYVLEVPTERVSLWRLLLRDADTTLGLIDARSARDPASHLAVLTAMPDALVWTHLGEEGALAAPTLERIYGTSGLGWDAETGDGLDAILKHLRDRARRSLPLRPLRHIA